MIGSRQVVHQWWCCSLGLGLDGVDGEFRRESIGVVKAVGEVEGLESDWEGNL